MATDLIDLHIDAMIAQGMAESTLRTRRIILIAADAADEFEFGLDNAEQREVIRYLGRRDEHGRPTWSANSLSTISYHLRAFYSWAKAAGELDLDVTAGLRPPPKRRTGARPITDAQLEMAVALTVDPVRTCVVLGAYAGLRCCEIASVYREDINPDTITVIGKGGDAASCTTHAAVWRTVEPLPPGLVILSVGGQADADWVSRTVRRALRRIGIPASAHQLRHTYATRLRRSGADLFVVQQELRHKSITSAQIYAGVSAAERRAAVDQVPTLGMS
jgi:integrase/recombinase XerD